MSDSRKSITCNKCGQRVPFLRRDMMKHAMIAHWDDVLRSIGEKVAANDDGASGLYGIGEKLGKQMQADGVKGHHVASAIWEGIKRAKN